MVGGGEMMTLREQQSAFIARLVRDGRAVCDLTPDERKEAAALGFMFRLPQFPRNEPMPERPTYNDILRRW